MKAGNHELDKIEDQEWVDSLEAILQERGPHRARELLEKLQQHALRQGLIAPSAHQTPYLNSISPEAQVPYAGDHAVEWRIRSLIRWNAMAMVVRANRAEEGIGGHISTFASAATLYEVGYHHFFHAKSENHPGDQVYFQGHAAPGIYARAFLEGRLSREKLTNFRRELKAGGGLSSYPHPWGMPDFWQFPTVSMGLGPLMAVYQARFNRYLENRGLQKPSNAKVWAFLGDGEMDEPESTAGISLAGREKLDNLIFVINCNLQRLDGPVRGNGKIIQELEGLFSGAGWNVIKVIWGSDWDPLLARDHNGLLRQRMNEVCDGQYQKYSVSSGAYIREHFFGTHPELKAMVADYTDEQLRRLSRGGHDPNKVYAAYHEAVHHTGAPTVILAKTIKGYGLGEAGEGKNVTHQQKKMNEDELREFRTRFGIPISDEEVATAPFYRPAEQSAEIQYLQERRNVLGGFLPRRQVISNPLSIPSKDLYEEFYEGTEDRAVSTTMAFVRLLSKLLRHPEFGKRLVPIVSDEARTFGMESLFRQLGIYSSLGQLYEPVDAASLLYYKETKDGQILEEGITEAGSLSSFIAAGTSYATHQFSMLPFFIFYSMFGFQRVGDLIWAAGDMRTRGFLLGATSGRTTLSGEGLQHQDGQSHLLAYPFPNCKAYDPAYAFELAVIIEDGILRMLQNEEDIFYYITLMNENYPMPKMPAGIQEGILKGMYCFRKSERPESSQPVSSSSKSKVVQSLNANLFGSGAILNETLRAAKILEERYQVDCDVWSVTSYKELYRDAISTEEFNLLNPAQPLRKPYVRECLENAEGVFVAASDYVRALPESISKWFPKAPVILGTDGFGLSESRASLRKHFRVSGEWIVYATLVALAREGKIEATQVSQAGKELGCV